MSSVHQLIKEFGLLPHPEGGYYKETYRSSETIPAASLPGRFAGNRNFSTAIYFLLEQGSFSAFHRIKSDECWHFYSGDPLLVHIIHLNGDLDTITIGNDTSKGQKFQHVVPAGCWFASEPAQGSAFSFVGCTVSPGFDFEDFELAEAAKLIKEFPKHESLIQRLCRK
jgi:uncharacterized protein